MSWFHSGRSYLIFVLDICFSSDKLLSVDFSLFSNDDPPTFEEEEEEEEEVKSDFSECIVYSSEYLIDFFS
jgi:hypothetical protein